jgi:hypothetical protein
MFFMVILSSGASKHRPCRFVVPRFFRSSFGNLCDGAQIVRRSQMRSPKSAGRLATREAIRYPEAP